MCRFTLIIGLVCQMMLAPAVLAAPPVSPSLLPSLLPHLDYAKESPCLLGSGPCKETLLAYYNGSWTNDGKLADKTSRSNADVQPGRGYQGPGTITIAGLLTSDELIFDSPGTATCTVDGQLDIASGVKVWGMTVKRAGVTIGYYPFAEGSGAVAINAIMGELSLPHGEISSASLHTIMSDGTGFDLNQAGYTLANGSVYNELMGSTLLPAGTLIPATVTRVEKRVNNGASLNNTITLTDFNQFVNRPEKPFDIFEPYTDDEGNAGIHAAHYSKTPAQCGTKSVFPVVAGRIYELTFRQRIVAGLGQPGIKGFVGTGWLYRFGSTDKESKGYTSGLFRGFFLATTTRNVCVEFAPATPTMDAEYYITNVQLREIIPVEHTTKLTTVCFWGDSHTAGIYPYQMRSLMTNALIYNGGVGGETSTQIKNRLVAATDKHHLPAVICAGGVNIYDVSTVLADISMMVSTLGHDRYLILSPIGNSIHINGSSTRNKLNQVKSALAEMYGDKYVDIEQVVIDSYDPTKPQDVIDHNNGVTPSSLRSDDAHFTRIGYEIVANYLADNYTDFFTFSPQNFETQYSGKAAYNLTVHGYSLTSDGSLYISAPHLTGAETVESYVGTATPTVAAGRINITAGDMSRIKLSNGDDFICQSSPDSNQTTIYNVGNAGHDGIVTGGTPPFFTAHVDNAYLAQFGYQKSGDNYIPALAASGSVVKGLDACRDVAVLTAPQAPALINADKLLGNIFYDIAGNPKDVLLNDLTTTNNQFFIDRAMAIYGKPITGKCLEKTESYVKR